jgi:alkaline phosphatase D
MLSIDKAPLRRSMFVASRHACGLAIGLSIGLAAACAVADEGPLERIAFGSCARQHEPQPIWEAVVELKPERFLFIGDNIYGDSQDMNVLRAKYALLGAQPGFQKLRQTCPVLATWDDHDYGQNDGGADYPMRRQSQQVFLDFFGAKADDVRRTRDGVYSAYVAGPEGKRVQIILLDTRFFRSPLKPTTRTAEPGEGFRGRYGENTDPGATMLGEDQWTWLAEQLKVPAELRIIASSVQVVACENGWEYWANFPKERKRLFELIRTSKASGVVFVSGDRHLSEISELPADDPDGVGYPLIDVTSSSLNAPSGNKTKSGVRFANELNRYRVGLTFFDTNFGAVLVDWSQPDPVVRLQVRDEKGGVVLQRRTTLGRLTFPKE